MRAKRPKRYARMLYSADVLWFDRVEMSIRPRTGAWRCVVDSSGDFVSERRDQGARLWANIGDRLVLAGPTPADTAVFEVTAVGGGGFTLCLRIMSGHMNSEAKRVQILKASHAKKPEKRPA